MIGRVVLSVGAVAFSVGLLLYGMGTSYSPENGDMKQYGLIMLVAGLAATGIGIFMYRASEASLEAEARAKYGRENG